ncbi:hypothetical protein Q1695_002666 [Nippostrongylus brasiliensis]|nr:hypothetical protein Q1695_002666 [Nippostrongylus brasiliensis]
MASMSSVDLKTHLLLIQSSALIVKSLLCHLIGSAPPTRLSPPSDAYKSDDPPRSAPPFTTSSSLHNMRYFLIVAIPLIVSGQFNTQRANEAPSDAVPAWYQMSQKQQMAPGYSFGRNSAVPYERPQAAVNYQNYPSYITGRPAYPELMGAAQQARRYPAVGQDPNAELLAAIKDVVAKFKASLDETGLDQDVRLMGNQLRNTWQQLRTGPVNEQLGRFFEKVADDANRTPVRKP